MGNFGHVARIVTKFRHNLLAFQARDCEDGERIPPLPDAIVVEVPDGRVDVLWFVGGVVRLVEDECANGVATRRGEEGLGTFYAEPRSEGDEVVVGRGEIGSAGNISREEVVLLVVAGWVAADFGYVEKALDDAIEGVGVGSGEGGDVRFESFLVC